MMLDKLKTHIQMKSSLKYFVITFLSLPLICKSQKVTGDNIQKESGIFKVNGINIAFESFGNKNNETVMLIMGTGAQLTGWPEQFCTGLAEKGYHVVRFDNRDVGLSTKLDSLGSPSWPEIFPLIGTCDTSKLPYTLEDMAEDAIGLMDVLQIDKAHIVGASMGGAIAQLIAIHNQERVLT